MKTEDILNEREKTHGSFGFVSRLAQILREEIQKHISLIQSCDEDFETLTFYNQKEALDCILGKVARIVCGDASYADHWDDIAGYAMLGKGEVKGKLMKGSGGIGISEHVGSELLFDDAGELLLDDVGEVKEKGKVLPDEVEEEEKNRVCCFCNKNIIEAYYVYDCGGTTVDRFHIDCY